MYTNSVTANTLWVKTLQSYNLLTTLFKNPFFFSSEIDELAYKIKTEGVLNAST